MRRLALLAPGAGRLRCRQRGWQRPASTFAGLRDEATFVSEPQFQKAAGTLSVLRLVDENGRLVPGASLPCSMDDLLGIYRTMVRVNVVDQVMMPKQRQGDISFYMTGFGEEAAQVATAAALDMGDVIWGQYRELGAFMQRGFTIQQVVDQCMSRGDEPGKGRQMPVHYTDASINMQAITSPLGTGVPQSVGAGYAFRVNSEPRCGVCYFGDGAASTGDFAVALNFAATLKAQAIFICRNNGWAISTPANEQYAGDGIAARGIAYGVHTIRVDGNDMAAVYLATAQARELCLQGQPVLIELMTYRRGHHSTSDDAARYRPKEQVARMARQGLEPLSRAKLLLQDAGRWDDEQEEELRDATRAEVHAALKLGKEKKFAAVRDMFEDVWATPTPELQRQRQELREHLDRHADHYAPALEQFKDGRAGC